MADEHSRISKNSHHNGLVCDHQAAKTKRRLTQRAKKPVLFAFNGEAWPSDDSNDSDYVVEPTMAAQRHRLDDSAIEGDSSGYEEKSDLSQCFPSDGQESQDSGTEVKADKASSEESKMEEEEEKCENLHINNSLKSHSKSGSHQNWVISVPNGAATEKGIMTIKFKLGDKVNSKRGRKRKNAEPPPKEIKVKEKKAKIKKEKKRAPRALKEKKVRIRKSVTFKDADDKCDDETRVKVEYDERWSKLIPENVLLKIFGMAIRKEGAFPFIKRVSKVCRLWETVAYSSTLWVKVDMSSSNCHKKDLNELNLKKLCEEFMSKTEDLNLGGWEKSLTLYGIKAIADNCPKLTSINLNHCSKMTSECIKLLADSCPKLSSIDLSAAAQHSSVNSPVGNYSLKYLFEKCGHQLTHLLLAENKVNNFLPVFKNIAEMCPNLVALDLSNILSTSSMVLPLEKFQQGCPKIKILRLANSNIALAPASLSLQARAPGFPELEELSIAVTKEYGSYLGDNDLERLVKSAHKLKLLDVRGCRSISVSGLVKVPAWEIEHLHLSQCAATKTTDLELILKKWNHSLKEVDLSWANNTDAIDQGVISLSCTDGESQLEILDVCGSAISLFSIRSVLEKCKRLHTLNLTSCRALPRGIKRLYKGDDLDRLREEIVEGKFDDDIKATVAKSEN